MYTLEVHDALENNIVEREIAIVKSTASNSSCNRFCDRKGHMPANTTKVTKEIKQQQRVLEICSRCESLAQHRCRGKNSHVYHADFVYNWFITTDNTYYWSNNKNLCCQSSSGRYHGDNPWAGLGSNLYPCGQIRQICVQFVHTW